MVSTDTTDTKRATDGYAEFSLRRQGIAGVPVLIYATTGHLVKRIFAEWTSKKVSLPAGKYIAIVKLPVSDPETVSFSVEPEKTTQVDLLQSRPSPHEWLLWATSRRSIQALSESGPNSGALEGAWARLWTGKERRWDVSENVLKELQADKDTLLFGAKIGNEDAFLQVGGPTFPWRLYRLPSSESVLILIAPAAAQTSPTESLVVTVTRGESPFQNLRQDEIFLEYLLSNEISTLKAIPDANVVAEDMLYDKQIDPYRAIVGAYFLLRRGDLKRLHDWTRNLYQLFPRIADTAIILMSHLLRYEPKDPRIPELLERAASSTSPIYTEGMRLLYEGLNIYRHRDPTLFASTRWRQVENLYSACIWTSPYLSFLGRSPEHPSSIPTLGTPDHARLARPKLSKQERLARKEIRAYRGEERVQVTQGVRASKRYSSKVGDREATAIADERAAPPKLASLSTPTIAKDPVKGVLYFRRKGSNVTKQ